MYAVWSWLIYFLSSTDIWTMRMLWQSLIRREGHLIVVDDGRQAGEDGERQSASRNDRILAVAPNYVVDWFGITVKRISGASMSSKSALKYLKSFTLLEWREIVFFYCESSTLCEMFYYRRLTGFKLNWLLYLSLRMWSYLIYLYLFLFMLYTKHQISHKILTNSWVIKLLPWIKKWVTLYFFFSLINLLLNLV